MPDASAGIMNYLDDRTTKMMFATDSVTSGISMQYAYDYVGRVSSVTRGTAGANANGNINSFTATTALGTTYTFVASGFDQYDANATTPLVAGITHGCGMTFGYMYDNVGNITQETRDGATTTYVYDRLGQLTRVNDPNDKTSGSSGTTWTYEYDCGGNILQKKRYPYKVGTMMRRAGQRRYGTTVHCTGTSTTCRVTS